MRNNLIVLLLVMVFFAACSMDGKTGSQGSADAEVRCDPVVNGTACPDFPCVMEHILNESAKVAAVSEGRNVSACDPVIMIAKCKYVELVPYETQCTVKMGRFNGSSKVMTGSCGFLDALPDAMMGLESPTVLCDALGWDQPDHGW